MKYFILIVLHIFMFPFVIWGQDMKYVSINDSNVRPEVFEQAIDSRLMADSISKFIGCCTYPQMLFSINNNTFLIICNKNNKYVGYIVKISLHGHKKEKVRINKKKQELLHGAFNLNNYYENFVTVISEGIYQSKIYGGIITSYFVVINADGNRFGEYFMPIHYLPPINPALWGFLVSEIFK